MRTQFFQDMVQGNETCYCVAHPNVLVLESVVGEYAARVLAESGTDEENPYKNASVYRRMLREQYLVRARTRAKHPKARMV
jgi:hypothetical protein